jgi:hypothetical protein
MTKSEAAKQIARAYGALGGKGTFVRLARIADMVDMTTEQIEAGVQHLYRTDDAFDAVPMTNQGDLTAEDRAAAVKVGGQPRHLIRWQ